METCNDFRNFILDHFKYLTVANYMSQAFYKDTKFNCETLNVGCLYVTGIELEKTAWSFTA